MLLQSGQSLGLERVDLMRAASVQDAELADRDAYLPFHKHIALGEAIVRGRPGVNIGLSALQHIAPATFGVLGYLINNASSLEAALAMFMRFQRLMTDGIRWRLEVAKTAKILVDADPDYQRLGHPIVGLVGVWLQLGRMLTGTEWMPLSVRFRHAPLGDPAEVERFFGCRVQFRSSQNSLEMACSTLSLPLVVGNAALQPSLRQLAQSRLAEIDGHSSLAGRLQALMFESVPRGVTTQPPLARTLGLSTRTLSRRLREEGTSFRAVLDDVRRELAVVWLSDPAHAIYEVSFLLGYNEPSTFHRSFRRWTGESPRAWRAKQLPHSQS